MITLEMILIAGAMLLWLIFVHLRYRSQLKIDIEKLKGKSLPIINNLDGKYQDLVFAGRNGAHLNFFAELFTKYRNKELNLELLLHSSKGVIYRMYKTNDTANIDLNYDHFTMSVNIDKTDISTKRTIEYSTIIGVRVGGVEEPWISLNTLALFDFDIHEDVLENVNKQIFMIPTFYKEVVEKPNNVIQLGK